MHLHFLGICGTFMSGLALIARELGHRVTGSDQNVYPPMDAVLDRAGITPISGYDPGQLQPAPDLIVVGNADDPRQPVRGAHARSRAPVHVRPPVARPSGCSRTGT